MLYNANLSVVANPPLILSLVIGFPRKFLDFSGLRKIIFWYRIYRCCAMVERKSFKTKICVLYKRGRCSRQDCPFAHGDAELRRFSGSFHGRQDFGGGDLRDKIGRRHSPRRIHSPVKEARGRNTFHECSRSGSLDTERERDRRHKKKQRLDYQSDISGSLRISDAAEYQVKGGKFRTDSRGVLVKQLEEVELDIERFDHRKSQLGVKLEEKVQEVDSLTSKIQELEVQLNKEREENKRILSKINKFVKAHNRCTEIQDQLKRSEVRLHKLGDELACDFTKIVANEEDSSINIVSEEETAGFLVSPHKEQQNGALQSNTRQDASKPLRESKQVKVCMDAPVRSKKVSRGNIPAQSNCEKEIEASRNGRSSPIGNEGKHEKRSIVNDLSADKVKSLDSRLVLPSTSLAAHAVDEVENESEDNIGVAGTASTRVEKGATHEIKDMPPPPPLPILQNSYSQYKDDDEKIDIDGDEDYEKTDMDGDEDEEEEEDEEEMVQVDIV